MAIPYPIGLPSPLATKTRSQAATFAQLDPRRGPAYTQKTGDDTPTQWDLTFRFTEQQAQIFWLWFSQAAYLDGGANEFTLPLRTEFGIVTHTCRFVPDSLMPASNDARVWTYTGKITARKLVIPQSYLDAAELMIELPNWNDFTEPLDYLINLYVPQS